MKKVLLSISSLSLFLQGQAQNGLDPVDILKPLSDQWTTYSGDYSGKRYSALAQINQTTVKNLGLAWVTRVTAGTGPSGSAPGGGGGRGGGASAPIIVGGLGTGDLNTGGARFSYSQSRLENGLPLY